MRFVIRMFFVFTLGNGIICVYLYATRNRGPPRNGRKIRQIGLGHVYRYEVVHVLAITFPCLVKMERYQLQR